MLSKESGVQVWQNDLPWSAATSVICRQTALLHGIQGAPLRLYFAFVPDPGAPIHSMHRHSGWCKGRVWGSWRDENSTGMGLHSGDCRT